LDEQQTTGFQCVFDFFKQLSPLRWRGKLEKDADDQVVVSSFPIKRLPITAMEIQCAESE
jgi:hypothetical protein